MKRRGLSFSSHLLSSEKREVLSQISLAGSLVSGTVVDYWLRSPVLSQGLLPIDTNTFATSSEFYNAEISVCLM